MKACWFFPLTNRTCENRRQLFYKMRNDHVSIVEVGPRDGLQNEKTIIASEDKIKLVNLLSDCGFDTIEVTSFVSPKWVPQLADASVVMSGISRHPRISYAVLTPNLKGYTQAKESNASEVAIFAAASETFSQNNINCSIDESLVRFGRVMDAARVDQVPVRGYISCVVDCPYEGKVLPSAVCSVATRLLDMGCYEISLGDTTGNGTPQSIGTMLDCVIEHISVDKLAGHYHDTNHRTLENIDISLEKGLRRFDSSIGGIGGCPYAPGARGNVATSDVVRFLHDKNISTGIDLDKLSLALQFVHSLFEQNSAN